MESPSEFALLRTHGWLAETPESFRTAVLSRCIVKRFERGETLYRAGDEPGGLYGLIDGGFGVIVAPGDRTPFLGILARMGFWIGEASVITRGPRAIGIVALRDSVAAYLPLAQWDAVLRIEPEAWRWMAQLALRNELFALRVIDALRMRTSPQRLAAILCLIAGQGRPGAGGGETLSLEVSQEDLATMANLSRSSVGRILDGFEAEGLIERRYRGVSVLDLERLSRCREP